ncbi:hypothetical protein [Achromobacter xylosoxidans]|uniref:Uncharacterized protein n=1 Tax=Achromobacter phage JWX TaxID=1589746 RepID=A0A0B5A566_9CAUD|nr:hypothetical protein [Achromobacter xylosoxidans]YP_009196188.1 hypothetical protein AVV28_gp03 [Achromobacter phage JWX]YP_009196249.1 hypothetical protein AVV28_gp52 [Achromobacter phage JWX]AJD82769.1 hypothetical protein JWX_00003 [Achromobacter phage JWX]AJD82830.1 hypothetical protein JWX_00065 [Achromobacter phage JWX]
MSEKEEMERSAASMVEQSIKETWPAWVEEIVQEGNRLTLMTSLGEVYEIYVEKC